MRAIATATATATACDLQILPVPPLCNINILETLSTVRKRRYGEMQRYKYCCSAQVIHFNSNLRVYCQSTENTVADALISAVFKPTKND